MIQDSSGVETKDDRLGRWLLWVSLGLLFLGLLSVVGKRIPWPIAYTLVSVVVLLLALISPKKYRVLIVAAAATVVIAWWITAFLEFAFTESALLRGRMVPVDDIRVLAGGLAALVAVATVGGVLLSGLYFASEFLLAFRGMFGLTRWEALRLLGCSGFGLQAPYVVVEDGKVTLTRPKGLLGKVGGPGLVIIRPGNAVAFERQGEVTQIAGPGPAFTKLFEFPKEPVVQLRPRWLSFEVDDVMTKDGVPLKLVGGVEGQIEPQEDTDKRLGHPDFRDQKTWKWQNAKERRQIIGGDFPVYRDTVFRAMYMHSGPNWEATLKGATLALIREAVGKRRLADIFGEPTAGVNGDGKRVISILEQEVQSKLDGFSPEWGVKVLGVTISLLVPPTEVQESVRKQWTTAADRRSIQEIGEAEAGAIKIIEATKKDSFDQMMGVLEDAMRRVRRTGDDAQVKRFQRLLETIATNVGRDSTANLRYIEALEKLSKHPGARIIIGPPGGDINVEQQ